MAGLLKSGAQPNREGRGGLTGAAASRAVEVGIARALRIMANPAPIAFPARADAAELILSASRDRYTGLRAIDRVNAIGSLRSLIEDERVPDQLALRCLRIILAATGRTAHRKGTTS